MNTKKHLALTLATLLTVALLAGCGAVAKDMAMEAPMENGMIAEGIYDSVKILGICFVG